MFTDLFARRVFKLAGIYGVLVLAPQYLMETGLIPVPPLHLSRPSDFYGFVGVALVWQFIFLLIASDPRRYRALIPLAILEKLAFGIPVFALFVTGRVGGDVLTFGAIDMILACLFFMTLDPVGAPIRA